MARLTDQTVLLFYREIERDKFFPHDRYLRRMVRPAYNLFRRDQKVSGFYMWYQRLILALRRAGCHVELNNYALARQNPQYPVGLVGYPTLLDTWQLPNPALLGPALYDHPAIAPQLMEDTRYRLYLVTCDWMADLFRPVYGPQRVRSWYAGIETDSWIPGQPREKDVDVLIYDKVRWDRDVYEPELIQPIVRELAARGLRTHLLRYGKYSHVAYRNLLRRSRAMLFLCEHETQGMAYQEALASDVPIMAWDPGTWRDPQRLAYADDPIPTTSVPYFSAECGERFQGIHDFTSVLDRFMVRLPSYTPRSYVKRALSLEGSAQLYLEGYRSML